MKCLIYKKTYFNTWGRGDRLGGDTDWGRNTSGYYASPKQLHKAPSHFTKTWNTTHFLQNTWKINVKQSITFTFHTWVLIVNAGPNPTPQIWQIQRKNQKIETGAKLIIIGRGRQWPYYCPFLGWIAIENTNMPSMNLLAMAQKGQPPLQEGWRWRLTTTWERPSQIDCSQLEPQIRIAKRE